MEKIISKLQRWKEKAKERSIIIAALQKRIVEILIGRALWKERYLNLKEEHEELKAELRYGQKNKGTKIKHHTYTSEQISLALKLRHEGKCSYRSCALVMKILSEWLGYSWRIPSPTNIRNWDIILGYAKLQEQPILPTEYGLIMDESISIGSEKILLLAGVELAVYDFIKPLKMADVKILSINIGQSWKSANINPIIKNLEQRNNVIKYGCTDHASNLRKSLRDNNIPHIEDCGHLLGSLMKKKYKEDTIFKAFSEDLRKFRLKMQPSKNAKYIPPKWRSKGRFMNLWAVCEWAKKMLDLVLHYKKAVKPIAVLVDLEWLLAYENFITNLYKEQLLINGVNKELKHFGLSAQTLATCKVLIDESEIDQKLKGKMENYLSRNWSVAQNLKRVIASSDIVESIFGYFKNKIAKHPQGGITPGCLTIANYDKQLAPYQVKNALEKVKIIDIEVWRKKNLPTSIYQQRKRLFKSTG